VGLMANFRKDVRSKKVYFRNDEGVFEAIPDVLVLIDKNNLVKLYTNSIRLHNKYGKQIIEVK
jgi:DUF917 family protein